MAKTVLVLSGKGGVGKSSVTACLSSALTKLNKKVLLIDADIGFRSLDLILKVGTQVVYNWLDVIEERCNYKEALIKKNDKMFLLAAPNDFSESITEENIKSLLECYRNFDYIFIDAPAGSGEFHAILSKCVETALLVATPDTVCVRSADVAVQRAEQANDNISTRLIVNRYDIDEAVSGRQLKLDDIIDSVHTRLIGVVPDDDSIRLITSSISISRPASNAFSRIARRMNGEYVEFNQKQFNK